MRARSSLARWLLVCAALVSSSWIASDRPVTAQSGSEPELPRVLLNTACPNVTGTRIEVNAGDSQGLQTALDIAQPGDEIVLRAGSTYEGNFTLPTRPPGTGWIVIRSSALSQLPVNQRVSPAQAPLLARIVSRTQQPPLRTATGTSSAVAHHYWLAGLELGVADNYSPAADVFSLVHLGNGTETSESVLPSDITVDRCYVHGRSGVHVRHAVTLNLRRGAVINSHVADIHSASGDAQAIWGANGPGPFKIVNNHLEASSENIMFGGADPRITNLVPSDIEIRRNRFFKPLSWRNSSYVIKNLFELKNARRLLVEGNVFENTWFARVGAQRFAIALTVRNQDGAAPWSVVEDVTFRYNTLRHAPGVVNITGQDNTASSQRTRRVKFVNNVFEDISPGWVDSGLSTHGWPILVQASRANANAPEYVTFDHNTIVHSSNAVVWVGASSAGATDDLPYFRYTNNISAHLGGVRGDGTGIGRPTFDAYFPVGLLFASNIMVGGAQYEPFYQIAGRAYGNRFPATWADVGFVNFNGGNGGNYRLASTSPYTRSATDGKDLGADIGALEAAQSGGSAPAPAPPPPSPGSGWVSQDVGSAGLAGSATLSNGVLTIRGAGSDIWGTADAFQFVHQPFDVDGQIVARVNSVQNTNPFAKAGVMMRDSLNANSPHVVLGIRPTGQVEFMKRSAAGGTTTFLAGATVALPHWVRLVRTGTTIAASISPDGTSWTTVGSTTVTLPRTIRAGMVVNSHSATQLNTSVFQGFTLLPLPWADADIGSVGAPGNASHGAGVLRIGGAGADIWGAADGFHYVYRPLSGDGRVTTRVVSLQNTHTFAKVGLMMRAGLAANAAHVVLAVRPGGQVEFMRRATAGGTTTFLAGGTVSLPSWLRLTRTGSTITGSVSSNGSTWTTIGSTTVTLPATASVGVAVTSHNRSQLNASVVSDLATAP